ncbi:hypothetical protein BW687_011965 [Pseudomonas graminis]|uniref:hypothetical protein n=1 Tax=Pseudomonas graminis TaxID=158627 RepID=UPI00234A76DD|nr:hypothetical protein [Pseudomonas graminis]MDC6380888.1 hypothetical protein [Pseudomonas graminis]
MNALPGNTRKPSHPARSKWRWPVRAPNLPCAGAIEAMPSLHMPSFSSAVEA